jgi:predicted PurR-regulated permease PerM
VEIDEKLLKRINRQLRTIRIMLGFFTLVTLAVLAIWIFIAYKLVTFTHNIDNKVTNIQNSTNQKLDIKSQLCSDTTSSLAKQFCNE